MLAQDPLPDPGVVGSFYLPAYSAYNSDTSISWMSRVVFVQDARRISQMVSRDGRILDVGCGNGAALLALGRLG